MLRAWASMKLGTLVAHAPAMRMQQNIENGGLLSCRPCDARAAKYDLVDTQRTHFGQDEDAHTCIKDHEDALGLPGTRITRAIVPSAGKALRINLTALGPRVLPFSELVSRQETLSEPRNKRVLLFTDGGLIRLSG